MTQKVCAQTERELKSNNKSQGDCVNLITGIIVANGTAHTARDALRELGGLTARQTRVPHLREERKRLWVSPSTWGSLPRTCSRKWCAVLVSQKSALIETDYLLLIIAVQVEVLAKKAVVTLLILVVMMMMKNSISTFWGPLRSMTKWNGKVMMLIGCPLLTH